MTPRFARSMVVSATTGVFIDGEEFAFYIASDGPEVRGLSQDELTTVSIPVIVDGFVLIETVNGRRRVIDGEIGAGLGDIADWARTYVRDRLGARLPWLALPSPRGDL